MTPIDTHKLRELLKEQFGEALLTSDSELSPASRLSDFWAQKVTDSLSEDESGNESGNESGDILIFSSWE